MSTKMLETPTNPVKTYLNFHKCFSVAIDNMLLNKHPPQKIFRRYFQVLSVGKFISMQCIYVSQSRGILGIGGSDSRAQN